MYKTILLPTDGSEYTTAAIEQTIPLAKLTGSTVHALYVFDTRDYNTLPESKSYTLDETIREQSEIALQEILNQCQENGVPIVTATERGVPHEEILSYADEHDVDLIVMATHGRTGFDHFLHGSITEKVIHQAKVPVVAIHVQNETTAAVS